MSTRTVTFTSRSVVVNSAYVVHDLPDVFIVEADTKTKYFGVNSTYFDSRDNTNGVLLETYDYSMRKGDDDGYTEIEVTGLEGDGWICIANGGRYTACICWYRAPKTKE